MHLILTGATGLVGTAVLHHILSLPATSPLAQKITHLSIISRRPEIPLLNHPNRPTQNTHTQIKVFTHKDFKDYTQDNLLQNLKTAGSSTSDGTDGKEVVGVVWALGISSTLTKSDDEYDTITRQFPLEAARVFSDDLDAEQVNFVYVSGEGAKPNPGMFTPLFGRVKGRTETDLIALMEKHKNLRVFNARPGGVDAGVEESQKVVKEVTTTGEGTGPQARSAIGYKVLEGTVLKVLRAGVYQGMWSPTEELGRVLVELAVGDGQAKSDVKGVEAGGRTLPNIALRRIGGSIK